MKTMNFPIMIVVETEEEPNIESTLQMIRDGQAEIDWTDLYFDSGPVVYVTRKDELSTEIPKEADIASENTTGATDNQA